MDLFENLISDCRDADMILIGLGSQVNKESFKKEDDLNSILKIFNQFLDKKNYFIVTSHKQNIFADSDFNSRRIANPLMMEENREIEEKQWDLYNKWLSGTLNKKLVIIELGEGFNMPNLFRWPFEKVNFINLKSKLYRVHDTFYQLPENIADRGVSIQKNANVFLHELKKYICNK
ncbi:MAG: hypothetical protein ACLRLD_08585 [Lachnospira sp.]